jgi:DNA-binding NtrC family response regulator
MRISCKSAEVFDRLKEINPDIKVLVAGGNELESQVVKILPCGCIGFVKKPYPMAQLRRKIERASGLVVNP